MCGIFFSARLETPLDRSDDDRNSKEVFHNLSQTLQAANAPRGMSRSYIYES